VVVACHSAAAPTLAPVKQTESVCWWTLLRTALPADSVSARFESAYKRLGMNDVNTSRSADTAWVVARLVLVNGMALGSRAVAYRQDDSTSFRFFVETSPSEHATRAPSDSALPGPDNIAICKEIARVAAIPWSNPSRPPNGDDSLPVWRPRKIASFSGITFEIDSSDDRGPAAGIFKTFTGVVTFARDRGRLDIKSRAKSLSVRVAASVISAPRGDSGDYYLFDSSGYALVRPASKTFSTGTVSSNSFNYQERRDGWPRSFEFSKPHVDTLSKNAPTSPSAQHQRIPVYWHLDLGHSPTIRVLVRGRMVIDDAPLGEVSVARWFGAAAAFSRIPGGVSSLKNAPLRITTVTVLLDDTAHGTATNLIALHSLSSLEVMQISFDRLAIPNDYRETPWDGSQHGHRGSAIQIDENSKWKKDP
jgi:hypothetical protein